MMDAGDDSDIANLIFSANSYVYMYEFLIWLDKDNLSPCSKLCIDFNFVSVKWYLFFLCSLLLEQDF